MQTPGDAGFPDLLDAPTEYRLVFAVDAVGYSKRSHSGQEDIQRRLVELACKVLRDVGVSIEDRDRQESGDGLTVALPAGTEVHRALPRLLSGWREQLAWDNGRFRDRLRVRLALAYGPFSHAANGFGGLAVIEAGRLLDCPSLRTAVIDHPEADIVAMVSGRLYDDVVAAGRPGLSSSEFTRARIRTKKYQGAGWLWVSNSAAEEPARDCGKDKRWSWRRWTVLGGGLIVVAVSTIVVLVAVQSAHTPAGPTYAEEAEPIAPMRSTADRPDVSFADDIRISDAGLDIDAGPYVPAPGPPEVLLMSDADGPYLQIFNEATWWLSSSEPGERQCIDVRNSNPMHHTEKQRLRPDPGTGLCLLSEQGTVAFVRFTGPLSAAPAGIAARLLVFS